MAIARLEGKRKRLQSKQNRQEISNNAISLYNKNAVPVYNNYMQSQSQRKEEGEKMTEKKRGYVQTM